MSTVIKTASQEWFRRPDDERYLTLESLKAAVLTRKGESWTATPRMNTLRAVPGDNNAIGIEVYDPTHGERRTLAPTNHAFGQIAQYAGAPAAYLRKLPAELTSINLQWGFEHTPMRDDGLLLAQSNGTHSLRAITSTSYGRIWDHQVVEAVERVNQDGRWVIPSASYQANNPKRATTLYASDRDVFIFLVDPARPIQFQGRTLFRGFFTWNSEVGAAVYGLCTFLYDTVCDNRTIWGATDVRELRIRHTGGAPERFAYEGRKYLRQYAEESETRVVETLQRAADYALPESDGKEGRNNVTAWLQKRGFTKNVAVAAVNSAVAEHGQARSLWDIVNGVTAYARTVAHTDARVEIETNAGKLLNIVA